MKNRMTTCFASMAMFIAAVGFIPGSADAEYASASSSYNMSGAIPAPQLHQPIGCARPVANIYSSGADLDSAVLTLSGSSTLGANSGTLVLNGNGAVLDLGGTSQTVGTGILNSTLAGMGTVQAVTVNNGGLLSVGNSLGTMTFDGALIMSVGSTNIMEIFTGGFDVLNGDGAGTLTMSGSTVFDFTGNTLANGSTLELFQNWGSIPTIGSTFDLGASQPLNTSNADFVTVIPEPASAMMLLFGAGVGLAVHRVRRSAMRR